MHPAYSFQRYRRVIKLGRLPWLELFIDLYLPSSKNIVDADGILVGPSFHLTKSAYLKFYESNRGSV